MERTTFRMYSRIRFNRPIDKKKDYISPGGYIMVMNGKKVRFDFNDYAGSIDEKDKCILWAEQKNPDYSFIEVDGKEGEDISEEMLENVEEIEEFFVYLGDLETDLVPVAVESIIFSLPYKDWKQIKVKANVVKNAKVEC